MLENGLSMKYILFVCFQIFVALQIFYCRITKIDTSNHYIENIDIATNLFICSFINITYCPFIIMQHLSLTFFQKQVNYLVVSLTAHVVIKYKWEVYLSAGKPWKMFYTSASTSTLFGFLFPFHTSISSTTVVPYKTIGMCLVLLIKRQNHHSLIHFVKFIYKVRYFFSN